MSEQGAVVVIGGTRSIGREIVRYFAGRGDLVVMTGRDAVAAREVAAGMPGRVSSAVLDLAKPKGIASALKGVGPVRAIILSAIERDQNTIADYDIDRALSLATLKLVGYTEVVHTLMGRLTPDASIVMFGGLAKERPYPGSLTVSTVNAGVLGLVRSLVVELKPVRVNSLHPGLVEDSPYWEERQAALDVARSKTPIGRLARMDDIVDACAFLVDNRAVNGVELFIDGGISCV
ncbi:MAG TPA: SDR family oxidoreductase [Candidatus Limnocylindrales bacterium]|jgi:NAD(P)-dependent dehydrogenase (short-subunit alcohol dehydrogenase family)